MTGSPEEREVVLTARDRNALKWAAVMVRGVEKNWGDPDPRLGIREGEATSDVLKAIVARYDRAALSGGGDG